MMRRAVGSDRGVSTTAVRVVPTPLSVGVGSADCALPRIQRGCRLRGALTFPYRTAAIDLSRLLRCSSTAALKAVTV